MKVRVHADSAAAIGICRRSGIGRVRHLAVGQLWVQEGLRRGDFTLFKVQGDRNPADILTKCVAREVLDRHLGKLGFHRTAGRAETAPHAQLQAQTDQALMCVMAHAAAVTCIGANKPPRLPQWSDTKCRRVAKRRQQVVRQPNKCPSADNKWSDNRLQIPNKVVLSDQDANVCGGPRRSRHTQFAANSSASAAKVLFYEDG